MSDGRAERDARDEPDGKDRKTMRIVSNAAVIRGINPERANKIP